MHYLKNFPIPPSQNKIYRPINIKGYLRYAKSKTYSDYKKEVDEWYYNNLQSLRFIKESIKIYEAIHADVIFYMDRSELLTLKNTIKRNDTHNRLKALFDSICPILDIDDSKIWSGHFDKVVSKKRYCDILLKETKIKTIDEQ